MKKLGKKKLFIFIGVVVVLLIFVIGNLRKRSSGGVKVQTDKVTQGSITASVSGSAKIQPEIQVKISAKVAGQIMRLGVEEGDYVKKGQFLVQLDPEYYRAAVEQAESNLAFSKAGYEKSKNEYERSQKLFADNLISNAELEIAKSTYEQGKAQVDQTQAMLNQAKDNLNKTTIYSPMEGIVSQLNKKEGEMALGSQFTQDVIMIVADLTKMLAETEIDENDVVSVSMGDTSHITVDAYPDSMFKGVVKEIANTGLTKGQGTQEEVTNFMVKVAMLEKPDGLRPGMSATVDVLTETRDDVLKIPIQCVTVRSPLKPEAEEGSEESSEEMLEEEKPQKEEKPVRVVFIVKEGFAHQIEVKTGISSDTEWEIIQGVEEGDEVVSGSYRVLSKQLKDGDEVKVDNTLKKFDREEDE